MEEAERVVPNWVYLFASWSLFTLKSVNKNSINFVIKWTYSYNQMPIRPSYFFISKSGPHGVCLDSFWPLNKCSWGPLLHSQSCLYSAFLGFWRFSLRRVLLSPVELYFRSPARNVSSPAIFCSTRSTTSQSFLLFLAALMTLRPL